MYTDVVPNRGKGDESRKSDYQIDDESGPNLIKQLDGQYQ